MWWEVVQLCDGVVVDEREFHNADDAYRWAEEVAYTSAQHPDDCPGAVYVYPHWCALEPVDPDDDDWECCCSQYWTDHHPYAAWEYGRITWEGEHVELLDVDSPQEG